jgi:hypothetical protein
MQRVVCDVVGHHPQHGSRAGRRSPAQEMVIVPHAARRHLPVALRLAEVALALERLQCAAAKPIHPSLQPPAVMPPHLDFGLWGAAGQVEVHVIHLPSGQCHRPLERQHGAAWPN